VRSPRTSKEPAKARCLGGFLFFLEDDVRYKTPAAADLVPTSYHRLISLVRFRKIPAPEKDTSGDYSWTEEDIARARKALTHGGQQREKANVLR
jgi:hypothetical protein